LIPQAVVSAWPTILLCLIALVVLVLMKDKRENSKRR